ncbi:ATP-dependent DNA ligase [Rhizorhabdus sp. FW153]|uniref:ATP-dependent DNA ligase n=1 Tax=Rhizorhabdus sp. FW153 TaxID=3400216 RepID=UPI003CE9134D
MNAHPALARGDRLQGLCQLVTDFNGKIPAGGCVEEPKIDGIRMLWIDGELVTREGVPILGAEHIADDIRRMERAACRPLFVDGEWQVDASYGATRRHFSAKGSQGNAGILHAFDVMDMRQWRGQDVGHALLARKRALEKLCQPLGERSPVRPIPWGWVDTVEDARRVAQEVIAAGGEGVILKHANSTYKAGRSTNWQRIKRAETYDGYIRELISRQDNGDVLATMVVEIEGRLVRVCEGFTDRQRFDFMLSGDAMIGSVVEVEAVDRSAAGALLEARFIRRKA